MNKFSSITLFYLLFIALSASAQEYKAMMHDPSFTLQEVVEEAEKYFDTHDRGKGSGYIDYLRWKYKNELHYTANQDRATVDPYLITDLYGKNRYGRYLNKTSFSNGWVDLGPYDADNITSHYSAGIGRVESFYVDPNNTQTIYLGSRSGGFWRTYNEGATWENTTDTLVASGVNTIAVSPTNKDSVLINVRNADNGVSHGIYRSVDGGSNWQITVFNPENVGRGGMNGPSLYINKICYHPLRPSVVFIGTNVGIYRSTDGLASYSLIKSGNITDIEFHPTNADIIYYFNNATSTSRQTVLRSTNGGASFLGSFLISGNTTIAYLAVTPTNPKLVYLASRDGVWKSDDEGQNFQFIADPDDDENCRGFAVSDLDSNNMIYGYVDAFVSTDEGQSFSQKTRWYEPFSSSYIHADIRTAEIINGVMYVGTDGYLCKSNNNGTTFTKLNNGTGIRENYRLGLSQSNVHTTMCGSQDNGTSIYTENGWIEWNGGDGMEALIHPSNPEWMIGSWQYGQRSRTTDGGMTRRACNNPEYGSAGAYWVAPMLRDPLDHMKVYHFGSKIYASDSFGDVWYLVGDPNIGHIMSADISSEDPKKIIVSRQSNIRLTTDGGVSFVNRTNGSTNSNVSSLCFDPENDDVIIATYASYGNNGKKVFLSDNSGASWQNISYNLANMPVYDAVIHHADSSYIYLATEIGVYYKSMQSTTWELYSYNLPNVSVGELAIQHGANRLRAATWGRGLWDYTLVGREDHPQIVTTEITDPPTNYAPAEGSDQYVECKISYEEAIQEVYLMYSVNSTALDKKITFSLLSDSTYRSDSPLPTDLEDDLVYFKVFAKGQSSKLTETYRFMYRVRPFEYCFAVGSSNTTADYIDEVSLNGFTKLSDKESYADFSDNVIELHQDSVYTLTVGLSYHWNEDTVFAWIDYNHNAQFEPNELLEFDRLDSDHKARANFSIPSNANTTDTLRMRVRSQWSYSTPDPCGSITGEVEDYSITIEPGSLKVLEPGRSNVNIYPNPNSSRLHIKLADRSSTVNVKIYSIDGRIVLSKFYRSTELIELDHYLESGSYLLEIETENERSVHRVQIIR